MLKPLHLYLGQTLQKWFCFGKFVFIFKLGVKLRVSIGNIFFSFIYELYMSFCIFEWNFENTWTFFYWTYY